MSTKELQALLARLSDDTVLSEKLRASADLDAALAIALEAGFALTKADFLRYQATQILELSDEQLESAAGGGIASFNCTNNVVYIWAGGCGGALTDD